MDRYEEIAIRILAEIHCVYPPMEIDLEEREDGDRVSERWLAEPHLPAILDWNERKLH